jgi:hypothetical protein
MLFSSTPNYVVILSHFKREKNLQKNRQVISKCKFFSFRATKVK